MPPDSRALLRMATLFYAGVAAAAALWAWLFGGLEHLLGERGAGGAYFLQGVLLGLGIVAAGLLGRRIFPSIARALDTLASLLGPIRPAEGLYLALLSGFAEELLFRGALWPQLGLVGSAVLFGLLHTVPVRALLAYPVYAAACGFAFGLLRERSGSVLPPVVAHATVNAISLAYLGAMHRGRVEPPAEAESAPPARDGAQHLPIGQQVAEGFPLTIWRYDLRVEIRGTDRESLPECLEHENLALFRFMPRDEVYARLRAGSFVFVESLREPLGAFPEDVATLSAYLFQTLQGIEMAERYVDETTTDDVRAWKVVAQRGEWVKVPLVVPPAVDGKFAVDSEREDVAVLAAHWEEYPRWFQDGMRFKYPALRDL